MDWFKSFAKNKNKKSLARTRANEPRNSIKKMY